MRDRKENDRIMEKEELKKDKTNRLKAIRFIFSFAKPNCFAYWLGFLPYCSQEFATTLLCSIFYNVITAGILHRNTLSVLEAGVLYMTGFAVYLQIVAYAMRQYRKATEKSVYRLKKDVLRSFLQTDLEHQESTGTNIALINTEVNAAAGLLDQPFLFLAGCLFSIVGSFAVMMLISPPLGLLAAFIGAVSYFVQLVYIKPMARIQRESLSLNKRLSALFADRLANREVICAYAQENTVCEEFSEQGILLLTLAQKAGFIGFKQELFTTPVSFFTLTGVLVLGGWLVLKGGLTLPALIMLPGICTLFTSGMASLGKCWADMQAPVEAAKNLLRIVDSPAEISSKKIPDSDKAVLPAKNGFLEVSELSFIYRESDKYALKHVSFTAPQNALILVVGRSGSGKSTLLKLLAGIYVRETLPIRLGEWQYDEISIEEWQSKCAYVDQAYSLFQMTIEENILMGNPKAEKEAVIQAAKASGAQQQRIALARALIRDVPLYIFDEITASLDPKTEQGIFQQIFNLRGKRTVLLSTHNLSYAPKADMILVMEQGELVQTGTHGILMKQEGVYRDLFFGAEEV